MNKTDDFVYGSLLRTSMRWGSKTQIVTESDDEESDDVYTHVHPLFTGQYTGLKDKNGVEVYEGDILKPTTNYIYKFGNYGSIKYEEDYGGFICIGEYSKNQHHQLLTCDLAFECEVIGNIYENTELL